MGIQPEPSRLQFLHACAAAPQWREIGYKNKCLLAVAHCGPMKFHILKARAVDSILLRN